MHAEYDMTMGEKKRKSNHHHQDQQHCKSVDKISALPEHLLQYILSFLPTKTVVQTCLVSKSWKNLWHSVPCLDLDLTMFPTSPKAFGNFVESLVRQLHECGRSSPSYIQKLRLFCDFHLDYSDSKNIESCIAFAGANNVQVIDIAISLCMPSNFYSDVFTYSSVRILILKSTTPFDINITLLPTTSIHLPFLKILCLTALLFTEDVEPLFSGSSCPVLETLVIENCYFVQSRILNISSSHLRNLTFRATRAPTPDAIVFSIPNLRSFKINLHSWCNVHFTDNRLISLSDAHVSSAQATLLRHDSYYKSLIQLIKFLGIQVQSLSLAVDENLVSELWKGIRAPHSMDALFCNLKQLKLTTKFRNYDVMLINTLLKYSPCLESLILVNDKDLALLIGQVTIEYETSSCIRSHLKMVEIRQFQGCENETKFVKFLLENAEVLNKVSIQYDDNTSKDRTKMLKIGKDLQTHPQASPSVRIHYKSQF